MIVSLLKSKVSTEFYKFIIVGSYSTIINYGIFYISLELLLINYIIASAIGFISGVFAGYSFNRKWTFSIRSERKKIEIIQYYSVYIFSLILGLLLLKIFVSVVNIDPKVANIIAIGITTCTNFIGIKMVVFR
ncbi:MAG: GtrA family protein [Alphaproteobacteria bacterium]|nr:GtrA family protein [Alphaproteobacteria bacterium]